MISQAQYDALGPLAREIIDADRKIDAERCVLAGAPAIKIEWGHHLRKRNSERARLSAAAATLCNRGTAGGPTCPRTA